MRNTNRKNLIIYTVIVFCLGVFVARYWEDLRNIKIVNPSAAIFIVGFLFLFLIVNGLTNLVILRGYNVPITLGVSIGLASANSLGNLLVPMRGGTVSNAVFLKRKYNFSYSLFLSLLSAIYIVIFWTNSLFGVMAMLFRKFVHNQEIPLDLFMFFLMVFVFFSTIMIFSPKVPLTRYSFINRFIKVINDWKLINRNKRVIFPLIFLTILNIGITTFASYFEFVLIGERIDIDKLVVYTIFSSFSLLVSVTPGNVGIRESFAAYSAFVLGIPLPLVLVVSMVDRLFYLIVSVLAVGMTARFIKDTTTSNKKPS